jgi:membrane protein required for colicin V production
MANLPAWLNPFDVLITLALLAGVAVGFVRGLVRMILSLLVLYVAAVLALTLHRTAGNWILYIFSLPGNVSQGMAFLLILVLTWLIISFVLRRTYKDTELPGVRQIDQLGGLVVGFFVTCVWIGFAILIIAFLLRTPVSDEPTFQTNLTAYFRSSALIPIFYELLPIAVATLRPWLPKGLSPDILSLGGLGL